MRSYSLVLGVSSLVAAGALVLACGSTSTKTTYVEAGAPEGGGTDSGMATDDGGSQDSGTTTPDAGDGGTKDSGMTVTPPPGTSLASSMNGFTLWAVTPDGNAIYSDRLAPTGTKNATLKVYATPVAGGSTTTITTLTNVTNPQIGNSGNVVYIFDDVATASATQAPKSPLAIWTSAGGFKRLSMNSMTGLVAASTDGSAVLYLDNIASAAKGVSGDLYGAPTGSAGSPVALETNIVTNQTATGTCFPRAEFGGTGSSTLAAAFHCEAAGDAGTTSGFLTTWTFDSGTGAFTQAGEITGLNGTQPNLSLDTAGDRVFTVDGSQNGVAYPLTAGVFGTAVQIDTKVFYGFLVPDGSRVIYGSVPGTDGGTNAVLSTASSTTPTPTQLVVNNFIGMLSPPTSLSPDTNWLFTFSATSSSTGFSDMWLANTTTPSSNGSASKLSAATEGTLFAAGYTADSKYALWYDPVPTSGAAAGVGPLGVTNVSSKMTTTLAPQVWNDFALGGSKIAYNDNAAGGANQLTGTGDIEVVDLAVTMTPTKLVSTADVNFYVSPDNTKAIYTYYVPGSSVSGLYAVAIP